MQTLMSKFNPRPKELDPVEGVAWGNNATLRLVSGPTYHNIELVTDITDPAHIERVMLKLNGREIVNVTGQDLVDLQEHRKNFVEAGRYIIPFSDLTMRTKQGVMLGELVTLPGEIWMLYIQLKSQVATQPVIRARSHTTAAKAQRIYLPRLYTMTWPYSGAGRTLYDFPERSPFYSIKRLHIKESTCERVRVIRDEREEMNVSKVDNAYDLAVSNLEQQTGWFTLDFVRTGFGAEGRLSTAANSQLGFELDKTGTGNVAVIVEGIEQVKAINAPQ